jgi:hypothetical protein
MPIAELQKFRSQYPQYGDMDDMTLATKLATKYPQYGDLVEKVKIEKSPRTVKGVFGDVPENEFIQGERNIAGNIIERPAAAMRGLIQKGPEGFRAGADNPASVPTFQDLAIEKSQENVIPNAVSRKGILAANKPLGMATTIAEAYVKGMLPSTIGYAADIATNPFDIGTSLIPVAPGVKQIIKVAGKTRPALEVSKMLNTPISTLPSVIKNEAGQIVSKVFNPERAIKNADIKISKVINYGIEKGIRPSVAGKQSAGRMVKYYKNAEEGVKEIVRQKNVLFKDEAGEFITKLPESVPDTARAIETAKGNIFRQYDAVARKAGEEGAKYDSIPIVRKLFKVSDDLNFNPKIRKYAEELIPEINELQGASPLVVQERIKDLNQSLTGYYAGRVDKAKAQLDASVASLMRQGLDDVIEKTTGQQYQSLKNTYGSLKAIEKEVNHRAVVMLRGAPKNVFDLTDVFSGGKILSGVLHGNPAEIATGAAQYGIKSWYKKINNPDYIIKNMFKNVDKLMTKAERIRMGLPPVFEAEIVSILPINKTRGIGFSGTKQLKYQPQETKALPGSKIKYGEGIFRGTENMPPEFTGDFLASDLAQGIPINTQKRLIGEAQKRLTNQTRLLSPPSTRYADNFTFRDITPFERNLLQQRVKKPLNQLDIAGQQKAKELLRELWDEVEY